MKTNLSGLAKMLSLLLLGSISNNFKAQTTALITDINVGTGNSSPTVFTAVGAMNTIFFVADNGSTGAELWKYDISNGISSLVKDINSGSAGSGITNITPNIAGNGIIFNANDGTNGNELWKSDGTAAGTSLVMDINVGSASSNPNNFCASGGSFIFSADNGTNGKEPWVTNGSAAGTAMLKDINPGITASDPNNFLLVGTKILFRANDGTNGSELWSTDMTAANTLLIKDINPGSATSVPSNFAAMGNTLFFTASDATNGAELWKSDGTTAGTTLIKDINPGTANSINISPGGKAYFTVFNNALYFQASSGNTTGYELWTSDGTTAGTVLLKDIQSGSGSSFPSGLFASPTNLFFTANDGTNGFEVWMSDGTAMGTSLLKDINPGTASGATVTITFVRTSNGNVYFAADNGVNGIELWKTLGSTATTTLVSDINTGAAGSSPAGLCGFNNILYFSANDGTVGVEPWKFDPAAPTGITAISNDIFAFEIFPNPCAGKLNIVSTEKKLDIEIYSFEGQLMYSEKNYNGPSLSVSELSAGIYFVKAISINGASVKKVVVN